MAQQALRKWPGTISQAAGIIVIMSLLIFHDHTVLAQGATKTVTTYVIKTQEEREQTRWTLTEWLRIKERMKLMDVWLAMVSDPQKQKFSPEFNVSYSLTRSSMERKVDGVLTDNGNAQGQIIRGQIWLTNLVSSQLGVRTLNLDLGFEAGGRDSGMLSSQDYESTSTGLQFEESAMKTAADHPSARSNWYSLNLRLFGKHIQDSSLILKYGIAQIANTLQLPSSSHQSQASLQWDDQFGTGRFLGSEVQIYLTRSIGLEGTGHQYQIFKSSHATHKLDGTYGEGSLFLEFGILRLQAGIYEERWNARWSDVNTTTREAGYVSGLKLML